MVLTLADLPSGWEEDTADDEEDEDAEGDELRATS
jgi:hypothetical protein